MSYIFEMGVEQEVVRRPYPQVHAVAEVVAEEHHPEPKRQKKISKGFHSFRETEKNSCLLEVCLCTMAFDSQMQAQMEDGEVAPIKEEKIGQFYIFPPTQEDTIK